MSNGNPPASALNATASPADAQDLAQHQTLAADHESLIADERKAAEDLARAKEWTMDRSAFDMVAELEAEVEDLCGMGAAISGSWLDPEVKPSEIDGLRKVVGHARTMVARLSGSAAIAKATAKLEASKAALASFEKEHGLLLGLKPKSAPGNGTSVDRPPEVRASGDVPAATGAAGEARVIVAPEPVIETKLERAPLPVSVLAVPTEGAAAAKLRAFVEAPDGDGKSYRGWTPSGAFKVGKLKKATRALIDQWHEATPEKKRNEIGAKIAAAGWKFTAGSLPEAPEPVERTIAEEMAILGFELNPKVVPAFDWAESALRNWITDWRTGETPEEELEEELTRETGWRRKAAHWRGVC